MIPPRASPTIGPMARRRDPLLPLGLVLLRMVTGLVLLSRGWGWLKSGGFDGRLVAEAVRDSFPRIADWLAWWGRHVVLANPDASAFLWRWGAFLVGIAFLFGALTRPAGLIAVLFLAHAIVYGPVESKLLFLLLAVVAFSLASAGAGRRMGLDSVFDQHFPSWVTWRRSPRSGFLS